MSEMDKNDAKKTKFLPYLPSAPNQAKTKSKLPKMSAKNLRMAYAQMNLLSAMINQHIPMLESEVKQKTSENEKLLAMLEEKQRKLVRMMKLDAMKQKELQSTITSLQEEITGLKRVTENDRPKLPRQKWVYFRSVYIRSSR